MILKNTSGRVIHLPNGQILEGSRGMGPQAHAIEPGYLEIEEKMLDGWAHLTLIKALFDSGELSEAKAIPVAKPATDDDVSDKKHAKR